MKGVAINLTNQVFIKLKHIYLDFKCYVNMFCIKFKYAIITLIIAYLMLII